MKVTAEDFQPRRDGWFEHKGKWQEVSLGTVIAGRKRSERWEIVEQAHGAQVEYGHTLWMRAREQTTGAEFTVRPRQKNSAVTILTQSPADTKTAPPTEPSDTEAIQLLIRELGAVHLATKDEITGEITCPDYASGRSYGDNSYGREEIEHMRFAHGLQVDDDMSVVEWITLHGRAHNPKYPDIGKGGFPHRHVPEDLSMFG